MDFAEQFEIYKQNVTPAMLEVLASDLNQSLVSLQQLGVGFYPAKQSWVFAERDHKGSIVGLSLRTLDGKKFMVEGSKRGLIYQYNENHTEGGHRYDAGRCHWIRISDAGVECPVCGKPDWCLISSDDTDDPSAVLCSRISEGSVREIAGSGYLHIRKEQAEYTGSNRSTLSQTELPILVVEGASDVLAAMDLGFVAIGKPSAKGGISELREMPLAGKEVWVIGENDAGAGKEGMEKTVVNIRDITDSLISVMPPEGVKDLRQWVSHGLTQESLFAYVGQYGHTSNDDPNIFPDDIARTIAKRFLEQYEFEGARTLRRHHDRWAEWINGKYEYLIESELRGRIYRYLDGKQYIHVTAAEVKVAPYKPTRAKVTDIIDALNGEASVIGVAPVWTEQRGRPDTQNIIVFRNGIMDVNKFCAGDIDNCMLRPTPELFTTAILPYDYRPDAWSSLMDQYCNTTFSGDAESIRLLAQWMGYNLVYDMSQEKFMICIGPTRSGKSTITSAMAAMLGKDQCGTTSLSALANQFGLSPLVGKSTVIAGDVKGTMRRAEMDAALENILKITGRDAVLVNAKYATQYEVELRCRFTMAMNDLPQFSDNSKAILARALILCFPNTYEGNEDFTLKDRLRKEAENGNLINFALWGLKDLRESGRFAEPWLSKYEKRALTTLTAPVLAFVEDCCLISSDVEIARDQLYEAYKVWCKDNGRKSGNNIHFGRWLALELPHVQAKRVSTSGDINRDRQRVYRGVTLSNEAFNKLLGRPE